MAAKITLACGNAILVDDEDVPLVLSRKWRYRKSGGSHGAQCYVTANTDTKQLFLHRLILSAKPGQIVDHISGDRLDNQKSNLRFATHAQNMRNSKKHRDGKTSRFKGVRRTKYGKFMALIRDGEGQRYLGSFSSEAEAAYQYDAASMVIHGEFGRRNFLPLC
jgi:hypothetical protein